MNELAEIIKNFGIASVLVIYGIGILFVLLAAVIFFLGYVYDCFVYKMAIRIGRWMGRKIPRIKHVNWIRRIWNAMQPKETYLRYETPLITYCFSYTAIVFLSTAFPFKEGVNIVVASMVYLLCYFFGMKRRYGTNERCYEEVLRNNSDFLKLSFLPLTFLITVLGFYCTVTGTNINDVHVDYQLAQEITMRLFDDIDTSEVFSIIRLMVLGILVVLLLYIISLPIQVIAYFIISVISYFGVHKKGYVGIFKVYKKILKEVFKDVINFMGIKDKIVKGNISVRGDNRNKSKKGSYWDDLNKRWKWVKKVKEFYNENKALSICSLIAMGLILSYYITYDMPELVKGINKWYELLVTLCIGIITNLMFYIFQVYVPKKKEEKIAYELVLSRLQMICRNSWEYFLVAEYFFEDVQKGILVIKDPVVYYKLIEEKDGNRGWGGKFDFRKNLVTSIESLEESIEKIIGDRVFSNCSDELITIVANIQRTLFFSSLKRAQEDNFPKGVTYGDCEREYGLLKNNLERLRELVDPMKCYSIKELTEEEIGILMSRIAQELPEGYEVKQFAKIYI